MNTTGYWSRILANRVGRRRALAGAAGLGAAAALSACGGGSDSGGGSDQSGAGKDDGTAKPGGIWRTADNVVPPHFSPIHRGSDPSAVNTWRRDFGYYDRLWGLRNTSDPARQLYMRLASSVEQVDELTVIAKMREAYYHDQKQSKFNSQVNGRQATAEDVAAVVEFMKAAKPGEILASAITSGKDLKSVTAVDKLTLRYEMFRPLAFFYESGSNGANAYYALPKEMLDTDVIKQEIPIGTGPFMFKSYQQGSVEDMVRNPKYFMKDRPYLEGKRLTMVPDDAAKEAAFRSGQVDTYGFSSIRQRDAVMSDLGKRITVVDVSGGGTGMAFIVNIHRKPFDDIRVREAMYRSVNVDRIIDVVYFKDAVRSWFFTDTQYERFPVGNKGVEKYVGYDPKKAADLLKASGADLDKTYEIMVPPESQTWVDSGRLAAEDWGKVGLKVKPDPQVRAIYLSRAGPPPGDFDITMGVYLDYAYMRSVAGANWENVSLEDSEIDATIEQVLGTMDLQKRKELSQKFEMLLAQKYANFMPMLVPNAHTGMYSYLKGRDMEMSNTGLGGWQPNLWFDKV